MIDLSLLPDGGVRWLDASGPHADIVLSTRVRLARNIEGFAFTGRARDGERLSMRGRVIDLYVRRGHDLIVVDLGLFGENDRPVAHIKHTAIIKLREEK